MAKELDGAVDNLLHAMEGNRGFGQPAFLQVDFSKPGGYYHGSLNRDQTNALLLNKPDGYYLVRDSSTAPGDLVLSVSESRRVSHYIISKRGNMYIIGDQRFTMMPVLIEFYKTHILDTSVLTEPVLYGQPSSHSVSSPPVVTSPPPATTPSVIRGLPIGNVPAPASAVATGRATSTLEPAKAVFAAAVNDLPAVSTHAPQAGVLARVKAMFDFFSDDPEDLSFQKGATLSIFEKTDDNWWQAQDEEGNRGSIPGNYVQVFESFSAEFPVSKQVGSRTASNVSIGEAADGNRSTHTSTSNLRSSSVPVLRPPPSNSGDMKKLVKIFSGDSQVKAVLLSPNLNLCSNVIVAALSKFRATGPHSLYQIAPNGDEMLIDENTDVRDVVAMWGEHEKDYKLQLKKSADAGPHAGEPYRAVQNRLASAYDDTALSFKDGDIVYVLHRDENGTWYGESGGKSGYFPSSYVQPF